MPEPAYAGLSHALAVELSKARESLAIHYSATERAREFLLRLHRSNCTLPTDIQSELDQLLRVFLNLGGSRPRGRGAQRSWAEKQTIVREYDAALQAGYGSAMAVARKYGTSPTSIIRWREQIAEGESGSPTPDPSWIGQDVNPLVRALAGKRLPGRKPFERKWKGKK